MEDVSGPSEYDRFTQSLSLAELLIEQRYRSSIDIRYGNTDALGYAGTYVGWLKLHLERQKAALSEADIIDLESKKEEWERARAEIAKDEPNWDPLRHLFREKAEEIKKGGDFGKPLGNTQRANAYFNLANSLGA